MPFDFLKRKKPGVESTPEPAAGAGRSGSDTARRITARSRATSTWVSNGLVT